MIQSLETLSKGKGKSLQLQNNLPLITVLFLVTLPLLTPQHILSLDEDDI